MLNVECSEIRPQFYLNRSSRGRGENPPAATTLDFAVPFRFSGRGHAPAKVCEVVWVGRLASLERFK